MPDIDPIKAKVIIEYDGSGLEKAKEDLASLGEIGVGSGEIVGGLTEDLAALDKQAGQTAESTGSLTEALAPLPKMMEESGSTIAEATGAFEEHQQAIEDTASAYEDLQKPVESAAKSFQEAAPSMQLINEHAQVMGEHLAQVNQAFADMASIPEPAGATQAYTDLFQSLSGENYASSPLGNLQAFQAALENPEPFQAIYDHLDKTGQGYEEFANSLGESNVQLLHEMSTDWAQTSAFVDETGKGFTTMGKSAQEGLGTVAISAKEANQAVSDFLGVASPEMKSIGFGEAFAGAGEGIMGALGNIMMPLMAAQMIGMTVQQIGQGIYDAAAIAEGPGAHGFGTFTGTVDALGQSIQKTAAQFSEGVGQGILPSLNALNYQASQAGGLGDQGHGLGDALGFLWNLGQIGTGMNVVGGVEGLVNQGAAFLGLQQPFQGPGPQAQAQIQYQQAFANMPKTIQGQGYQLQTQSDMYLQMASDPNFLADQDQLMAAQQIYQHAQQSYSISHPINRQQMLMDYQYQQYAAQQEANYAYQQANAPTYLGAITGELFQGNFGAAGQDFNTATGFGPIEEAIGRFFGNSGGQQSLYGGGTHAPSTPFDNLSGGVGNFFGGIGQLWNDSWGQFGQDFHNMFQSFGWEQPPQSMSTGGCFVAGTRVLMANGTEQAIETLHVGEQVQAHDGEKQVTTTILAFIQPPPKRVYKLTFSSGQTLTLTASHPIATSEGWKSISPEAARQENPGLATAPLQIGDKVHTADGIVTLTSILPLQIWRKVYNITVDNPHTFYANKVLVHNKTVNAQIGQQVADQIGTIQLPHIDLSGITAGLADAFGGISLPPLNLGELTAGLASAFSGISLPPLPNIGGMLSGAMAGMFGGISLPAIPDIGGMLSGALSGMLGGIALPSIPDIGGMLNGAMSGMFAGIGLPSIPDIGSMLSGAMSGMFAGIGLPAVPDIGGMLSGAMSGMFGGISIPSVPNIGAMINGALSSMFSGISIPSIPMFARGVQNYTGLGIVGEAGPELVSLNGGSVYPLTQSNNSGSLSLDGGLGLLGGDITLHIQMVMPNGQMMAEQYIPYIAPLIRQQFGRRA